MVRLLFWPIYIANVCLNSSVGLGGLGLAFIGWRQPQRFAIFGDGAARDRDAFAGEQLGDAAVGQRMAVIFFLDELAVLGAPGGGGRPPATGGFALAQKEFFVSDHP